MQGNLVVKRLALPVQKLSCNPDLNVQCPAPKAKSEPMDVCERERSATPRRGRPSAREKEKERERERDEGGERKRAKQEVVGVGANEGAHTSRSAKDSEQQQQQQRLEAKQKEKEKDAEGDGDKRSTRLREQRGATSPNKAAGATSDAPAGTSQPAAATGLVTLEWPSARLLQALLSNNGWLRSVRLQLLVWTREVRIPTKMSHLDLSPDYRMHAFL